MKRIALFAPFFLVTLFSFISRWTGNYSVVGNLWFLSFVGCVLLVPVWARKQLWLGYAALAYPFAVLGVHVALDWGSLSIGWN